MTIVEDVSSDDIEEEDILDMAQDTVTIINNEIDGMDIDNKSGVKNLIRELYMEALSQ